VPKKELVLIASRAISLYLVFLVLSATLGNHTLPSVCHFALFQAQPSSPGQDYVYKFHLIQFISQIVVSTGLFPRRRVDLIDADLQIEAFLSPSEN